VLPAVCRAVVPGLSRVSGAGVPAQPAPSILPGRRLLLAAGGASLLGGCAALRPPPPPAAGRLLRDVPSFSSLAEPGSVPEGWRERVLRRDRAVTQYRTVERDGRVVLHARSESGSSGIGCDVDIDVAATPWLEWSWRVDAFPVGTSVADDERDDAPVRLVVAFDGDWRRASLRDVVFREQVELFTGHTVPFASLLYVWDGTAAAGTVVQYPRSGRVRYLVVESGAGGAGRWLHYRRNLADDYRLVFGEEPGPLRSIGVLTDSDDLRQTVEAWYGDIAVSG